MYRMCVEKKLTEGHVNLKCVRTVTINVPQTNTYTYMKKIGNNKKWNRK